MRIISGKYKGRNLISFKAGHIRPTMDRIKETIFNKWMMYVDESLVLDLFSGTGNLGLEALSRGAKSVDFVEKNFKSVQIIRENINLLKIPAHEYYIHQQDVFSFLKTEKNKKFNLIFIDPPFTEKLAHAVMESLSQSQVFDKDTLVVIESIKQERIDVKYGVLKSYDQQDYGDKFLTFFKVEE